MTSDEIRDVIFPGFSEQELRINVGVERTTINDRVLGIRHSFENRVVQMVLNGQDISFPGVKRMGRAGIAFPGGGEFFISTGDHDPLPDLPGFQALKIRIGAVSVRASYMSPTLFALMRWEHRDMLSPDFHISEDWSLPTITIRGLRNETQLLPCLDVALFKIGFSKYWEFKRWPTAGLGDWDPFHYEERDRFRIGNGKYEHEPPINFVNAAMRAGTDEERFILLYRALEFYWSFASSDRLTRIRRSKMRDAKFKNLIREEIKGGERASLQILLDQVVRKQDLARAKKNGWIREGSSKNLASYIYERRNSIVHGKADSNKLLTLLPRYIDEGVTTTEVDLLLQLVMRCINRWSRRDN